MHTNMTTSTLNLSLPSQEVIPQKNLIRIEESGEREIVRLKNQNQKILPYKIHMNRLALMGVLSIISVIAGLSLLILGAGLCLTGASIPLGVSLIAGGASLTIIGALFYRFYHTKIDQLNRVKQNEIKIDQLKKLIQDHTFRKFVSQFRQEIGFKHLSSAQLILKCDVEKLFNLFQLAVTEKTKNPRKRDSHRLVSWDYTAKFNYLSEKMRMVNSLLGEIHTEILSLNRKIKRDLSLAKRKTVLLERATILQYVRREILKKAPHADKISAVAYNYYLRRLEKNAERKFSALI